MIDQTYKDKCKQVRLRYGLEGVGEVNGEGVNKMVGGSCDSASHEGV